MGGVARCPESLVRNKMLIMHFDLNVKFCFFLFQIYHWALMIHTALLKLIKENIFIYLGK